MVRGSRRRIGACQRAGLRCALRSAVALAAWCLSSAAPAAAAPTDLASVSLDALLDLEVSGASKFSLRVSESPTSATVVTAEQIRALGFRTLADVLRSVRGVVVSSDRTYSYLGVRGFSTPGDFNTRVLLLIDGNRVNDTIYDQAFLGSEFPLDIDLVERVEFIPGQGSAVHGANALFGVVNVVTRKPGVRSSSEASAALGSGGARQLRVSTSQALSAESSMLLSATARRVAGTEADVSPAFVYLDDRRRGRRHALFAEDQWTLAPRVSVTAGLRYDRTYDVLDRQPDDLGSGSVLQPTSPQDGRSVRLKLDLAF